MANCCGDFGPLDCLPICPACCNKSCTEEYSGCLDCGGCGDVPCPEGETCE